MLDVVQVQPELRDVAVCQFGAAIFCVCGLFRQVDALSTYCRTCLSLPLFDCLIEEARPKFVSTAMLWFLDTNAARKVCCTVPSSEMISSSVVIKRCTGPVNASSRQHGGSVNKKDPKDRLDCRLI